MGSFQGDENQAGRQRGHRQEPGSGRRANRRGREDGRRGRDPADDLAGADRTTDYDPAADEADAGDGAGDGVRRADAGQVAEDGRCGADQGEGPVAGR